MFSVYCEQCGSVLLLGPANILAVQNSSEGIVVHFRCHAGHRGVWLASARSDRPVLRSKGGEHAPHLVTASATVGRSAGLRRDPSQGRGSSSTRPGRSTGTTPGTQPSSSTRPAPGTRSAPEAQPLSIGRQARSATPDAQPARRHLPGLDAVASGIEARRHARALQGSTPSSWTRWTRAPWRRGRQSCGGSGQR